MPWKETCVMDQRIAFVSAALRDEAPMSELCAAFGISRNTGYKWLRRWRDEGPAGLEDRSRAPHGHGRQMAPELAESSSVSPALVPIATVVVALPDVSGR